MPMGICPSRSAPFEDLRNLSSQAINSGNHRKLDITLRVLVQESTDSGKLMAAAHNFVTATEPRVELAGSRGPGYPFHAGIRLAAMHSTS